MMTGRCHRTEKQDLNIFSDFASKYVSKMFYFCVHGLWQRVKQFALYCWPGPELFDCYLTVVHLRQQVLIVDNFKNLLILQYLPDVNTIAYSKLRNYFKVAIVLLYSHICVGIIFGFVFCFFYRQTKTFYPVAFFLGLSLTLSLCEPLQSSDYFL